MKTDITIFKNTLEKLQIEPNKVSGYVLKNIVDGDIVKILDTLLPTDIEKILFEIKEELFYLQDGAIEKLEKDIIEAQKEGIVINEDTYEISFYGKMLKAINSILKVIDCANRIENERIRVIKLMDSSTKKSA